MKVHPYLNFAGNAQEAFNLYKSVFGGKFAANMKMKDAPDGDKLPKEEQSYTMHICLPIGEDTLLMASDCTESMGQKVILGNQSYVMLSPDSREEADRLFKGLSEGGNIEMPMEDMFWGDYFGCFRDRFGIQWMISVANRGIRE